MKRILVFLICAVMIASAALPAGAADLSADNDDGIAETGFSLLTEAQFSSKIASVSKKYPDGSTWAGVYYEDGAAKAWTCHGYAVQMYYEFFGAKYYAEGLYEYQYYDTSGICAGDIVRIDGDSHSIFVTEVTSSGIYFTDANYDGANTIEWNAFMSKSSLSSRFTYRYHLPGNTLKGGEVQYTIAYSGNGGSGSMSSDTITANGKFKLKNNSFKLSGYTFAGYTVRRSYDNKWYTTDAGWQSLSNIYDNAYNYKIYPQGNSYTLGTPWIGGISEACTFTFYAEWLPDKSTVEFMENQSGYNYILGSDLSSGYSDYIYSRDSSVYSVSVDRSEKLNNQNSLKIVGKSAGSSGADLAVVTSTNVGYGNGYSQTGIVGDDGEFYLRFCAKASVDGAKMYVRWGFSGSYQSVALTKSWKTYTVAVPKTRFYGATLHPYFDKKGTYYLNSLALGANGTTNVVPEKGTWAVSSRTVTRGGTLGTMPEPTRPGYDFLGWYTAAEGGTKVTGSTKINESALRLYAHWSKKVSYSPVMTISSNGHIYELYDNNMGWKDAEAFCEAKGGHLVTIDSSYENSIVYNMISDRQGYCWIGLSYDKTLGWHWVNDEWFIFNRWYDLKFGSEDTGEYYAMMYPMNLGTAEYAATWDKCVGSNSHRSYYGYYNSFYVCEYDTFLGDADGNCSIDIVDATIVERDIVGLPTYAFSGTIGRGDIDGDGELNITDSTFIRRYCADIDTPYDIGGIIL